MVLVLGAILANGYGTQGQKYVALLRRSEISAGFYYNNFILVSKNPSFCF